MKKLIVNILHLSSLKETKTPQFAVSFLHFEKCYRYTQHIQMFLVVSMSFPHISKIFFLKHRLPCKTFLLGHNMACASTIPLNRVLQGLIFFNILTLSLVLTELVFLEFNYADLKGGLRGILRGVLFWRGSGRNFSQIDK